LWSWVAFALGAFGDVIKACQTERLKESRLFAGPGSVAYSEFMAIRRMLAVVLWSLAGNVAYVTIRVGVVMVNLLFGDGWLGPEPELLYLVAELFVAGFFLWLGMRIWRSS
jgi:hypothetical protein